MTVPVDRACIFCGGKYEKIIKPKGMEDYEITTVLMNKIGTHELVIPKSLAFRCSTCGNIQTFVEEELEV
ncbi:MAG: hypothetical protein ACR2KF_07280 [Nitrososphaeraceae archaeon]